MTPTLAKRPVLPRSPVLSYVMSIPTSATTSAVVADPRETETEAERDLRFSSATVSADFRPLDVCDSARASCQSSTFSLSESSGSRCFFR